MNGNSRRRKKRPNYGLRTVQVERSHSGFGFTISGQQPCILSCIVVNSPADLAGLRAGDFLISVNGVSVSKSSHDAVVQLIGTSVGPIRMTIAENYYSDSSDEEIHHKQAVTCRKVKPRQQRGHHSSRRKEFVEEAAANVSLASMEDEGGPIEYKAIVGYLGTIEMPKQRMGSSHLQTICSCIKKLRHEKRKPSAVLMTVLPTCITLKNARNHILALYPVSRVMCIGTTADRESRYFGLITSASSGIAEGAESTNEEVWDEKKCNSNEGVDGVEVSNSCHVFMTDPKIVDHGIHAKKAENFNVECSRDIITGHCLEFPLSSLYIVSLVQNMYRLQSGQESPKLLDEVLANSPQPSASSNSDSGIGFRDDCGNISDRILLVEFPTGCYQPAAPVHCSNISRPSNISNLNLNLNLLPGTSADLNNVRATPTASAEEALDRLNCRAVFAERPVDVNFDVPQCMMDSVSMHSSKSLDLDGFKVPQRTVKKGKVKRTLKNNATSSSCDNLSCGNSYYNSGKEDFDACISGNTGNRIVDKLSPKVYLDKPSCKRSLRMSSSLSGSDDWGGSLKDISLWGMVKSLAQSEPDVRFCKSFSDKMCEDNGIVKVQQPGEGPAEWSKSFERLLDCPAGLHAFAQFLKKEFSAENIYFWTACERYRKITSCGERAEEAERIYRKYLQLGAPEAVNVDSHARQFAGDNLKNTNGNGFVPAQQQIFNLMKFDSYSRFLKSQIYENCLAGKEDRFQVDAELVLQPKVSKLKKSLSNAEDRRRKSLLPWHRKNRSRSKDRTESNKDVNENLKNCEMGHSRTSLTSLDMSVQQSNISNNNDLLKANNELVASGRNPLCRVKLGDGNTTVAQLKASETVSDLVVRLLEKRGITYTAFAVHTNKHSKPVNINESSYALAGCEVEIEERVCFKLDLPNKKIIAVKSKPSKALVDVLHPILEKYSFQLSQVDVLLSNSEPVNIALPVTSVNNERLIVLLKSRGLANETIPPTLEEITNKVYEDILQEKCDIKAKTAESVKSDDWGSENSSSFVGRFLKRDSSDRRDRKKKLAVRSKNNSSRSSSIEDLVNDNNCGDDGHSNGSLSVKKPLIAKLKIGAKVHNTSESEELYEGLSRAQRCRLDDQRGTKIDCAMPDFLKDSHNGSGSGESGAMLMVKRTSPRGDFSNYENKNLLDLGISANNFKMYDSARFNGASKCRPPLIYNNGIGKSEPPPLPPKPKVVPIKPSNWKARDEARALRENCNKELFLEKPTSSFV